MREGKDKLGHYWIIQGESYECPNCGEEITEGEKAYEYYKTKDNGRGKDLTLCKTCMRNTRVEKKL